MAKSELWHYCIKATIWRAHPVMRLFFFFFFFLRDFIFKKTLFEKLQYLKQERIHAASEKISVLFTNEW